MEKSQFFILIYKNKKLIMNQKDFNYYKKIEQKVLNYLNINIEKDQYSINDGYIINDKNVILFEFKFRNFESDRYDTHILEQKKFDELIKKAKNYYKKYNKKTKIYYLNLFADNKLYIYDLKTVYYNLKNPFNDVFEKKEMYMNKVTAYGSVYSGQKIKKVVYNLYKNNAKKIIKIR